MSRQKWRERKRHKTKKKVVFGDNPETLEYDIVGCQSCMNIFSVCDKKEKEREDKLLLANRLVSGC